MAAKTQLTNLEKSQRIRSLGISPGGMIDQDAIQARFDALIIIPLGKELDPYGTRGMGERSTTHHLLRRGNAMGNASLTHPTKVPRVDVSIVRGFLL